MHTSLVPITIVLLSISVLSGMTLSSSQISFAQQTENNTSSAIDITKLTGNENVEIGGNITKADFPGRENIYKFDEKPIIKINGQNLDYEYPVDTGDNAVVEDTLLSITMTTKVKLSETETKVLDVGLISNPDIIKDNPDGSKTYTNKPNSTVDHITIGDHYYSNISSTATINEDKTEGFIKAETK